MVRVPPAMRRVPAPSMMPALLSAIVVFGENVAGAAMAKRPACVSSEPPL